MSFVKFQREVNIEIHDYLSDFLVNEYCLVVHNKITVTCFILGALNNNKAMMKAKILRKMTSTDSDNNDTSGSNKENVDSNKAAVVIQSRKIKTSWQI